MLSTLGIPSRIIKYNSFWLAFLGIFLQSIFVYINFCERVSAPLNAAPEQILLQVCL